MDILENRHKNRPQPRWPKGVRQEIKRAASQTAYCDAILRERWLGEPINPTEQQAKEIYRIQTMLKRPGDSRYAHVGEAQSIYFAKVLQGQFATDDNEAYRLANQYILTSEQVIDSIDILTEAVTFNEISAEEADHIANNIEANDRHLRRVHIRPRGPGYFLS